MIEKALHSIEAAIEDIRAGKLVIVVDDESRENEGDLIMAAEHVTAGAVNFMATHGRGLICVALTGERLDALDIPLMVQRNTAPLGTAFCVSVEARHGTTTGISAGDRARTIKALADPASTPDDFLRPGHMFPLRARDAGVLERAGQTEAAVDLARLAGCQPAGVLCEIMSADGTMARRPELEEFARQHGLRIISVADLIHYRRHRERLTGRRAAARMPTRFGEFRAVAYESLVDRAEHLAMVRGDLGSRSAPLVRLHSECLTGDVLHSLRCDCGEQLEQALAAIASADRGVLLYLRQEGRGIGLVNKIRAYSLQEQGLDTVEANTELGFQADMRDYAIAAEILADLGVTRVRLMTNNPGKVAALEKYGVTVVERVPVLVQPNASNARYLFTKRQKLGHLMDPREWLDDAAG